MIIKKARSALRLATLSSIAVLVSPIVFAQHGSGQSQRHTTNLAGTWALNENLTDDPAEVMQAMQGGPGGGSGHGPSRHGGGGGSDKQMQAMHSVMEAPTRLTITQLDEAITFTDGNGRSQTLTTNNKREKLTLDDRTVEVRTKWDDGRLVKETSLGDGIKLTETYSLVSEPRQLHVM